MIGTTDWREQRRLRVLELYRKGWPQKTIAEALGITKGYVSRLIGRVKDLPENEQAAALRIENRAGRRPTFTQEDKRQILAIVERGAPTFGLPGEVWTLSRLRKVVRREVGLRVGQTWLWETLKEAGYSPQKPKRIAREQNDKAVAGFRGGWANLKRGQSEPVPR
jgi:transposase